MTEPADVPVPSRWTSLPGDPPDLRRCLAGQAHEPAPEDRPQDEVP